MKIFLTLKKTKNIMEAVDLSLTAVFVEAGEGGYTAFIEEIPGVNTQGETLDEARENLREALLLVMETNKQLAERNIMPDGKIHKEKFKMAS